MVISVRHIVKEKTLNFYTKTPNCNTYVLVNTITTANFPINFSFSEILTARKF